MTTNYNDGITKVKSSSCVNTEERAHRKEVKLFEVAVFNQADLKVQVWRDSSTMIAILQEWKKGRTGEDCRW